MCNASRNAERGLEQWIIEQLLEGARVTPAWLVGRTRAIGAVARGSRHGSGRATSHCTDPADFYAECDTGRPAVRHPDGAGGIPFGRGRPAAVRVALAAYARRSGLPEQRTYDEAVVNAVRSRHVGGAAVERPRRRGSRSLGLRRTHALPPPRGSHPAAGRVNS
ncbi:hypothetical protein ACIPC1_19660 [Streptomyces sp. NPDC087263]|uniref:hypothetical protein n=1 Tax=Streptomyces sp. NPDC087263 TaxID=3365773 RepID=UPI00382D58D7